MPQVRYCGPFSEVVLPSLGLETVPGGVIDVDDESYANLIQQRDWEAVGNNKTRVILDPEPVEHVAADAENGEPQ